MSPSHQERVKRNYHTIEIAENHDARLDEQVVEVRITRQLIASQMSKRSVLDEIHKFILKTIGHQYRER